MNAEMEWFEQYADIAYTPKSATTTTRMLPAP